MSWHGIEGHDQVVEQFRRSVSRGRLASTFLFVGPSGIGKRSFAMELARCLLCEESGDDPLSACGTCPNCTQMDTGTHPDVHLVAKPEDKSGIPVDLLIGDRDHRMQTGLCHEIGLKPYMGSRKIAVIDDADMLNQEGANCLLKTLEEPPPQSVLILISGSLDAQLPTIRSRSQIISFRPLSTDTVAQVLLARGVVDDPQRAAELASCSEGSVRSAIELADESLWQFRGTLLARLAAGDWQHVTFSKEVAVFVDDAGKAAPLRRERLRQVIRFGVQFHRNLIRQLNGAADGGDATISQYVTQAATARPDGLTEAIAGLERCLEALTDVSRNANQSTLIESWLDDLWRSQQRPVAKVQ